MSKKARFLILTVIVPILLGISNFMSVMDRPGVAALHSVDIFRLIVCGVLFGMALIASALLIRGKLPW